MLSILLPEKKDGQNGIKASKPALPKWSVITVSKFEIHPVFLFNADSI